MPNNVNYGRSMVGMYSLECKGKLTRGLESVIQDVFHTLVTVRGSLPANASLGLGLGDLILLGETTETIPAIASDIESELEKDSRISSVDAKVTADPSGGVVLDVLVTLAAGPAFSLIGPIGSIIAEVLSNGQ